MSSYRARYSPVLKIKMGEVRALAELREGIVDKVLPILEIPRVLRDFSNDPVGVPKKSMSAHVVSVCGSLVKKLKGRHFFFDLGAAEDFFSKNPDKVAEVFDYLRSEGVFPIPLLRLEYEESLLEALVREIGSSKFSFRIDFDEIEDFAKSVGAIEALVTRFSLAKSEGALLLDLGFVSTELRDRVGSAAEDFLANIQNGGWGYVSCGGASMPQTTSGHPSHKISSIRREEFSLFCELKQRLPESDFKFLDYGSSHPIHTELDPRLMTMGGKIRYTTEEAWLMVKGGSIKANGSEQYHKLCKDLVALDEYSGSEFSWGDDYIDQCAKQKCGPGNPTTWIAVSTNRHVTFVALQVAN